MKMGKTFAMIVALCMLLSLGAFASGEPAGNASGEPAAGASAEPAADASAEPAADASAEPAASGEASGEDASVEEAFIDYIHEWLLNELANNAQMTIEQVEDEFMPLVRQMNFTDFPAEMIYSGMLETGVPMTYEEFTAQYQPAAASGEASEAADASGEASEAPAASGEASAAPASAGYSADYAGWIQYLKDYVSSVPAAQANLSEFIAAIDAGTFTTFPADMLFVDTYWGAMAATYDEFIAAGGQVTIPDFSSVLAPD